MMLPVKKQTTKSLDDDWHPAQERGPSVAVHEFRHYLCNCAVSLAIWLH